MKEEILRVRMKTELRNKLQEHADKHNEGIASVSARQAIKLFLSENK